MVSLSALRTVAARRSALIAQRATQRRGMALGGSSGPPPDWQGVDKVVRSYFPQDYQLSIAILGGYTGLYVLYSLSSMMSKKKPVEEAKPVVVESTTTTTTGVPALDSPDFDKFFESDAFSKLLESEDQLTKLAESA